MDIKDIFNTEKRGGVIWNFQKYVTEEMKSSKLEIPLEFNKGKDLLSGSIHAAGLNRKRLEEACQCFLNVANQSKDNYIKLYAYLGAIACYYVLDDLGTLNKLVNEHINELELRKRFVSQINFTGVGQHTLKVLGVAVGGLLSFVPQTKMAGYALTQTALRMQTEDILEKEDRCFYGLKSEIMDLKYGELHQLCLKD